MAFEFHLPDIGEGVVEGEIVKWKVAVGDVVKLDQPIVEIMTDKATVEIPSPRAGIIAAINYGEGQICPVGQVLLSRVPLLPAARPAWGRAAGRAGCHRPERSGRWEQPHSPRRGTPPEACGPLGSRRSSSPTSRTRPCR